MNGPRRGRARRRGAWRRTPLLRQPPERSLRVRPGIGNRVEVARCGASRTSPPRAPRHRADTAARRDLVRREPGPEQPYRTLRRAPGNARPFQVRQPPAALDLAVGLGEQRPHLDEGGDGRAPGAGVLAPVPAGTLGKARLAVIRDRHRRGAGRAPSWCRHGAGGGFSGGRMVHGLESLRAVHDRGCVRARIHDDGGAIA